MESPQSPHSSSLWVFALRYSRVLSSSPTSALKSLGYYTSSTVLLFVGLRVISVVNVYDANDDVGAFLLVEEYACFGLKALKTELL